MRNVEMAAIFSRVGDLLEIQGENPFKIQAYRRAAETLTTLDAPAIDMIRQGAKIPGFGEAITAKIQEMEETGHLRFYENLTREVPISLIEVVRVPGLGPKTARLVYTQLGVTNLDELEAAARTHRLAGLKGVGPKREAQIVAGIEEMRRRSDRSTLGVALQLARAIEVRLAALPEVQEVAIAGSIRRLC